MGRKLILSLLILLVISSTTATAKIDFNTYISDFKVYSETNLQDCECKTFENQIVVENTGTIQSTYWITSDTPGVVFTPASFTLASGKEQFVKQKLTVPCEGSAVVGVLVTNKEEKEVGFSQSIESKFCNNLAVETLVGNLTGLPCQTFKPKFLIYNSGVSQEKYKISLGEFNGQARFTESLTIQSGKTQPLELELIPACSIYGRYLPRLIVETEGTQLVAEVPIELNILYAYDYELKAPQKISSCTEEEAVFELEIWNKAAFNNSYSIEGDVLPKEIDLASDDRKSIELTIQPTGEEELSLSIVPRLGEPRQIKIDYYSTPCYPLDIELEEGFLCEDEREFDLILSFRGSQERKAIVRATGAGISSIQETLELRQNEEQKVELELEEGTSVGTKDIEIQVEFEDGFTIYSTKQVELLSLYKCYEPQLAAKKIYIRQTEEKFKEKYLQLKNAGVREVTYKISQDFHTWLEVESENIRLQPGEEAHVIVQTEVNEDVPQGEYSADFKIVAQGQEYHQQVPITIYRFTFMESLWYYKCFVILPSLLLLFGIALFLAYLKRKTKNYWHLVALSLLLLLLVSAFFCFGSLQKVLGWKEVESIDENDYLCTNFLSDRICESKFYLRWDEDTPLSIDLSKYFFDPDSNELGFQAGKSENISISIQGSIATLKPRNNWHGIEKVTFFASEQDGTAVETPPFYLHVINKEEFHLSDYVLENHGKILLIMIILVIVVLIVGLARYLESK
jgi:uncharacterized membrane protein